MREIMRQEIGGGYSNKRKIIVNCVELCPGKFEVMALLQDGEELDCMETETECEAVAAFWKILWKYLLPLQKEAFSANMKPGGKYTILTLNEFGHPIAQKITFHTLDCATYAQYADVVKVTCKPYRKRGTYRWNLYNKSFAIYDGWKDLKESAYQTVLQSGNGVTVSRFKYGCFDSNFMEDCMATMGTPLALYKNYQTGVNGKIYA